MSGKSRIEKILENLLGENNVIEPPIGRDEKILYSILNDLEYTEPPHSIFEDLLLAIKNGSSTETEYAYDNLVRDEKILFCKLNRREYFEPPHSRLERLLIKWLYLDLYLNIDGIPPFTFASNGSPIIDYTIYGNTEMSGTPTPVSLVIPSGVGEKTTAPSYEPSGYKVTVSCGDTLTPIYLGEVQSTRKIKKLVLTGEENFVYDSNYTRFRFVMPNSLILGVRRTPVICTHYEAITDGRPIEDVPKNTIYSDSTRLDRWWIEAEDFTSANDFKAYLAEQYAAGTPITIWYILTEPETAIDNEPLMKIGDYADSISYEQTVVAIPTVSGRNTFDVLGDVKPSNVELTYAPRAPLLRTRKTVLKK